MQALHKSQCCHASHAISSTHLILIHAATITLKSHTSFHYIMLVAMWWPNMLFHTSTPTLKSTHQLPSLQLILLTNKYIGAPPFHSIAAILDTPFASRCPRRLLSLPQNPIIMFFYHFFWSKIMLRNNNFHKFIKKIFT